MKFKVITGIFENTIFEGFHQGKRVYNNETLGQSYPEENVVYFPEITIIKIYSHNFFKNLNYNDIVNIKKTDIYNCIVTINKGKKEFKISNYLIEVMIQQHKNNE